MSDKSAAIGLASASSAWPPPNSSACGLEMNDHVTASTMPRAANARLALLGGGAYLRDRIAGQASPPADLAKALNSFAGTIEQLGVNYLANAGNAAQAPLRRDLDGEITQLNKLCAPK